LLVDEERLAHVRNRSPIPAQPWAEPAHESLEGGWWIAELVPKLVYNPVTKRRRPAIGLGRHRTLQAGALIDRSVLDRLRAGAYHPPNLSDTFTTDVKKLATLPAADPYPG
jgi:hypothetical protein